MKPTLLLASALPLFAQAHSGHGLPGESHWHPTDAWGFAALAIVAGVALWLQRRK